MKTTPDNEKLLDLIDEARKGKIALPQFQRNFVWSRDDITALLVSILEGHFIGSFLLLAADGDELPFAARLVQGVELHGKKLAPERLILDGQQRLTSLHYAFAAPDIPLRWTKYAYRFFLDLRKVTEKQWEDAISSERGDYVGNRYQQDYQFENLVVPFTVLEDWNNWLNTYEQWLVARDKDLYFSQYFKIDKPAWTEAVDRIRNFLVPTLVIPKFKANDPVRIAEVCAIFEKMNSSGVRLSVYDLLTARLFKFGIDQHALWERAVEQHGLLNMLSDGKPDEFGVYVLRTIALMRGFDVKSKTLINLSPKEFEADFRQAVQFMEKAIGRIMSIGTDGFGAFDAKWIPYSTMVSPLAAMLHYVVSNKQIEEHRAYRLIKQWYWASVFRERYAGAVESTIYRDYQDWLKAVADPAFELAVVADARMTIVEGGNLPLRQTSRPNSIYRGVMCLLALRGAKDFRADDSIEFHTLDDHHIFPKAYLAKQKGSDGRPFSTERVNTVVNRTLIADKTNRRISNKSPSRYLEEVLPGAKHVEILASHFIDADALNAMQVNDYEAFLAAREKTLGTEIVARLNG